MANLDDILIFQLARISCQWGFLNLLLILCKFFLVSLMNSHHGPARDAGPAGICITPRVCRYRKQIFPGFEIYSLNIWHIHRVRL